LAGFQYVCVKLLQKKHLKRPTTVLREDLVFIYLFIYF